MKIMKMLVVIGMTVALAGCGSSTSTTPAAPSGSATLKVVNNSATSVWYLYVSPSTSRSWGTDQLGTSTVAPGATFTLNNITPCNQDYDVKALDSTRTNFGGSPIFNWYFACGSTYTINVN